MRKKNYQSIGADKFQRKVEERTIAALQEKHRQFAADHANDTDEQLADYLRRCARELDHSPNIDEVIGGRFIAYRFETWTKAIAYAGLSLPGRSPNLQRRKIYKDEYKKQVQILKQERKLQKQRSRENSEKESIPASERKK